MKVIYGETGRDVHHKLIDYLLFNHEVVRVSPRGQDTREAPCPVTLVMNDPTDPFPTGIGRQGLSLALAAAEGLSLIAGVQRPELLKRIAPFYGNFINPASGRLDGAYGPRVVTECFAILDRLRTDPDTRQAVLPIYASADTTGSHSKDVPCTLSLHFLLRNGQLRCHVTMRSSDAWLGIPYDLVQFAMLHVHLARSLDKRVGPLTLTAHSSHLYERNHDEAMDVHKPVTVPARGATSFTLGVIEGQPWQHFTWRACEILDGKCLSPVNAAEERMVQALAPFHDA